MCMCIYAAAAKSLQLCLTLCDPIDGSPPGSPVPGILQARILEWVAIPFSGIYMHTHTCILNFFFFFSNYLTENGERSLRKV